MTLVEVGSDTGQGSSAVEDHLLLPETHGDRTILYKTPGGFRLCLPASGPRLDAAHEPLFFQDDERVFFLQKEVPPEVATVISPERLMRLIEEARYGGGGHFSDHVETVFGRNLGPSTSADAGSGSNLVLYLPEYSGTVRQLVPAANKRYVFRTHYHPFVCLFLEQLNRHGITGLLDPAPVRGPVGGDDRSLLRRQRIRGTQSFNSRYDPNRDVVASRGDPIEEIEFSEDGAYSTYNWELFFHIPLMVADRLMQNQRFAEAQKWLHYIFDPTIGCDPSVDARLRDGPARFWKIRPFFEASDAQRSMEGLLRALNAGDVSLQRLIARWENDPFDPHLVARLRPVAYMKATVMMYLDNCLTWADYLFSQDTQESVAEATQLYLLAADILGPRPNIVPPRGEPAARTYEGLEDLLDDLSDALIRVEEELPAFSYPVERSRGALPRVLYFCIPPNDKLFAYWDKVADRLFKIRHCLNIEGVFRQLQLFEPPIDPALLVRARALGVDLREVLAGDVPLGPYRFQNLLQFANELCSDVRALGTALLSAIERTDAEALSRLRSEQEIRLLDAIQDIRDKQVDEAKETLDSLHESRNTTSVRFEFYSNIVDLNAWEMSALSFGGAAVTMKAVAWLAALTGAGTAHVPNFKAGTSGIASPVVTGEYGGKNLADASQSTTSAMNALADILSSTSMLMSTMGSNERRSQEWKLQEDLARQELSQLEKQVAAAEVRVQIAEKERDNHRVQREHARAVDEFMREKFSNQELFSWMEREAAGIYFQSYQLALDLARRAERALRYERGLDDNHPAIVRTGQWDSLRRGLLVGEKLQLDLRRLEMAWLDENRRELEITKHISLAQLDPEALIALRSTGVCEFGIREALFDLDFPGHYFRRMKSVSLTLPSIVGPYTGVNCTLTLLSSEFRRNAELRNGEHAKTQGVDGDDRFVRVQVPVQATATSNANNDAGLFELNLRDERYLPFEGAGADSRWRLRLPPVAWQPFDYRTISDVILHVRYTARDGGGDFRSKVESELAQSIARIIVRDGESEGFYRAFDLKSEFPNEWHRFVTSADHQHDFPITQDRFPYIFQGKKLQIDDVETHGVPKTGSTGTRVLTGWLIYPDPATIPMSTIGARPTNGGALRLKAPADEKGTVATLDTVIVVLRYQVSLAAPAQD